MCAIFGWFKPQFAAGVDRERLFRHLARKSQLHGEKSFGLAGRALSVAPRAGRAAAGAVEVVRFIGSASTWLAQNEKDLKKYAALDVLVGHTRWPSHGAVTKNNCHPFPIGDWLVAHNGCISNSAALMNRATYVAKGETDSEEALCYVVGQEFSPESLKKISGSWAFEAITRNGQRGLLMVDGGQNLHVAKAGTGWVWCTDGEILESSLKAAGVAAPEVSRIRSCILDLATGVKTELELAGPGYSVDGRNWGGSERMDDIIGSLRRKPSSSKKKIDPMLFPPDADADEVSQLMDQMHADDDFPPELS